MQIFAAGFFIIAKKLKCPSIHQLVNKQTAGQSYVEYYSAIKQERITIIHVT